MFFWGGINPINKHRLSILMIIFCFDLRIIKVTKITEIDIGTWSEEMKTWLIFGIGTCHAMWQPSWRKLLITTIGIPLSRSKRSFDQLSSALPFCLILTFQENIWMKVAENNPIKNISQVNSFPWSTLCVTPRVRQGKLLNQS